MKPKNFEKSQHSWLSCWRGSIEDKVVCPYNPRHVMPYRRLVLHIIPCSRKHAELGAQFMTCPYSSLHCFPKSQLETHLEGCAEHHMSLHTRIAAAPYVSAIPESANFHQLPNNETIDPRLVRLMDEWKDMV